MSNKLAKDENKIIYKNLSCKIHFTEEDGTRLHEINFLKNFGMLYNLLDNLLASKITTNNVNADQISFIINLMNGYDKDDLFDEGKEMNVNKGKSWEKKPLTKANKNFKTNPRKKAKSFFPKNFKEDILEDQNNILINEMKLYTDRNKIIKLFEDKNINAK